MTALAHKAAGPAGLQVTAIVDPDTDLAHQRVKEYQAGGNAGKWEGCEVFSDYQAMLQHQVGIACGHAA